MSNFYLFTNLQKMNSNYDKQKIIIDMCVTYRHDFGLTRDPNDPPWVAGLTPEERKGLIATMTQIFENNIEPLLKRENNEYTDC